MAVEPVWQTLPVRGHGPVPHTLIYSGCIAGQQLKQRVRLFALGGTEVGVAIESEQAGELRRAASHRLQRPAQHGSGIAQRADGVANIKLAVAKGAFAVFPGFAPLNAGEGDEDARRRRGDSLLLRCEGRAQLQHMLAHRVVMDSIGDAVDTLTDQPGFSRMQVAAGGIHAHGPAIRPVLFPGRQREAEFKQQTDGVAVQRARRDAAGLEQVGPGGRKLVGRQRQRGQRSAGVAAKRVGLGVPVQRIGAGRVAAQTVLGALVIGLRHGHGHGRGVIVNIELRHARPP